MITSPSRCDLRKCVRSWNSGARRPAKPTLPRPRRLAPRPPRRPTRHPSPAPRPRRRRILPSRWIVCSISPMATRRVCANWRLSTSTKPLPKSNRSRLPSRPGPPGGGVCRLLDFTKGARESLRELATLYIDQTATQVEQIAAAVQAGAAGEVRRLAHSCAGASATCGMRRMVPILRELEREGYEQKLTNAAELSRQVGDEFGRIRDFLEAHLANLSNLAAKR